MLRILLPFFLLTSCSVGTVSKGGKKAYLYRIEEEYKLPALRELAPKVIKVSHRDPPKGKWTEIFEPSKKDIKRIGILVFESQIQSTRSGLASEEGLIYPTASGKQLLTEKLLTIWEEALPIVDPEMEYLPSRVVKNSVFLHQSGAEVVDHVKGPRTEIVHDDIHYLEKGKLTATQTILNPRGMRDFSFVLVPAGELMKGPKWSEHQKHMVNEVARELKLDALLVILSEVNWHASYKDKLNGDRKPEQLEVKITATTLIPFSQYKERLGKASSGDDPMVNVALGAYQGTLTLPVSIDISFADRNIDTIKKNLLDPLFATYRDLALMTMIRMKEDWEKTR